MTKINLQYGSIVRIALSLYFFVFVFVPHARAQQSGLHGTVLDSTGAPIQGAEIEFNSNSATALGMTDAEGKFALTGVRWGPR